MIQRLRGALSALIFLICGLSGAVAQAQTPLAPGVAPAAAPPAAAPASPDADAVRCAALAKSDFSGVVDAPTQVRKTEVTTYGASPNKLCRVEGYVNSGIAFVLLLPLHDWNGKYVQGGCGGACGITIPFWCDSPVAHGYACLGTDMGHVSSTAEWQWGRDNLGLKADFGFRSTHVASLAGKAVAKSFYGSAPKRSYFMGCSTGGRQAYAEVERFPSDFDGVVGNAPPLSETGAAYQLAWTTLANLDSHGDYILKEAQARLLAAAVVKQCDLNDGLKDGLIGDPRRCKFDPVQIQCAAGQSADCLSPAQVAAARRMYAGPHDDQGRQIGHQGGVMLGSELNWIGDYLPRGDRQPQYYPFLSSFFAHAGLDTPPPFGWSLKDFDMVRDRERLGMNEFIYNAQNPDLREFKQRGGKLLTVQGWGDTSVVPGGIIDFYETVTRTMGGPDQTRDFYRLFLVPGMRHCSVDSAGADAIDFLGAIDAWVEQGKAPDALMGYRYDWRGPPSGSLPIFPLAPDRVRLTRIHFPYPEEARYIGKGDPNDPKTWKRVPAVR